MSALTRPFRRRYGRRAGGAAPARGTDERPPFEIAPDDPLLAHLQAARGVIDVEELELDSPAVRALKAAGVKLAIPLVSQGELIGVLNLGPRLSEQEYSADDRHLLGSLAAQAAPALRIGQLVRRQEAEAATRQRFEQELEVARLIQQHFLPKQLPDLPGWRVAACYRPAREVGGDFYDVIPLADGRVAFVVGDVTDKGVPAALVMSATRSVLRASAQRLLEPGAVLEEVNEHLCPDMPEKLFVTCLYALLDPASGRLRIGNAGHDLPYVKTADGVVELRARGMPLGLMPGMTYEETEAIVARGDTVLLHSDGIAEAHDRAREMYGFERLRRTVAEAAAGTSLIARVLEALAAFTGRDAAQEDDITLVALTREDEMELAAFELPSAPGNERQAIDRVRAATSAVGLPPARRERLETAIAEATSNAMEQGNGYRPDRPVAIRVLRSATTLRVRVTDFGGAAPMSAPTAPDIEAKLAGEQSPRGWGLFLIENMVDDAELTTDGERRTLDLVMHLEEAADAGA